MRGIFQNGGRSGNFQILISLLSYFLRPYNWLSWLLLHWAMLLVPLECYKPLPKSHSIIGQKAWLPRFFFRFFLLSFFFQASYSSPIKASWVSFFTVLGSRMCNDRVKRRNKTFSADEFIVVTARGFVVWCHLKYCSRDAHVIQLSMVLQQSMLQIDFLLKKGAHNQCNSAADYSTVA